MTSKNEKILEHLGGLVRSGLASGQEKVDFAIAVGESYANAWLPEVLVLLRDEDPEVRKYSLSAAVLDLDIVDADILEFCRDRLVNDEEESVRSMAAACFGKIVWNRRSREHFRFLKSRLDDPQESNLVRGSVFNALHYLMGVSPGLDWPGEPRFSRAVFDPAKHVDPALLAEFEASLTDNEGG